MKIKLTLSIAILLCVFSCKTKTEIDTNTTAMNDRGCLGSWELNPLVKGDTINKIYGKEGIKHGHWITFAWVNPEGKSLSAPRTKIEEGYYMENKKEGFWKFYNKDGTVKDSVKYENGIAI